MVQVPISWIPQPHVGLEHVDQASEKKLGGASRQVHVERGWTQLMDIPPFSWASYTHYMECVGGMTIPCIPCFDPNTCGHVLTNKSIHTSGLFGGSKAITCFFYPQFLSSIGEQHAT